MESISLVLLVLVVGLCFLPAIIAIGPGKVNAVAICALNFFLGGTLVG